MLRAFRRPGVRLAFRLVLVAFWVALAVLDAHRLVIFLAGLNAGVLTSMVLWTLGEWSEARHGR
jgi:hypothetical protein